MAVKRYFSKSFSKAKKTRYNGILFDSILEKDKYIHLKKLESQGKIKDLKTQIPFDLIVAQDRRKDIISSLGKTKKIKGVKYLADFTYTRLIDNQKVVMDAKGRVTDVYKLKLKMFLLCYPSCQFIECYRDDKKNNFNIY